MTTKAKSTAREPKIVIVATDVVTFLHRLEQHLKDGYAVDYSEFATAVPGCCTCTLILES
jgi:hypothetical protein